MKPRTQQEGMVFLVALVLLLAMTALGVGVIQYARREVAQVERQGGREVLKAAAESCIQEAMQWLEQQGISAPPCENQNLGTQCGSTIAKSMKDWDLPGDGDLMRALADGSAYSCAIYVASRETLGVASGAGFEVGQAQGYGQTQTLTKYLYRIVSQASGPDNASVKLEVVASMVY